MEKEIYATFVLPAPNGCNLRCPGCVIGQREEAKIVLTSADYLRFLTRCLTDFSIKKVSIQGFEPLLPETWSLTKEMLRISNNFFCDTSLITNGTYLSDHAAELCDYPGLLERLTISIDSADPATHDKSRGLQGAFESTMAGIQSISHSFHGQLAVNSILYPFKKESLVGMPALLDSLGIQEWAISPYIDVRKDVPVLHGAALKEDMLELVELARKYGIYVYLSDELGRSKSTDLFESFYVQTLGENEVVFRLSPDGTCSIGTEVLRPAKDSSIWNPGEDPVMFLQSALRARNTEPKQRGGLTKFLAQVAASRSR